MSDACVAAGDNPSDAAAPRHLPLHKGGVNARCTD